MHRGFAPPSCLDARRLPRDPVGPEQERLRFARDINVECVLSGRPRRLAASGRLQAPIQKATLRMYCFVERNASGNLAMPSPGGSLTKEGQPAAGLQL